MKKLTPIKLALTFAGCFLGAGYVSGQELWQFFGVFGKGGFFGAVLAAALLFGMMPVWFVGAVTFACYNVFGSFAILTPFARFIPDKKTTFLGTALGALVLLLIALSVLAALCAAPEALSAQLPMTLQAGTIISTGTPSGVALGMQTSGYLHVPTL